MTKNIYDVNFNFYGTMAVEANSEEEAEEAFFELDSKDVLEHIAENLHSIETGTIELVQEGDGLDGE